MQVLNSLPKGCEIKYNHDSDRVQENLTGVGGSALLVRGTAKIKFDLARGYGYEHEFIIIESSSSILLLGNDFWCRYMCVLTYGTGMTGQPTFTAPHQQRDQQPVKPGSKRDWPTPGRDGGL